MKIRQWLGYNADASQYLLRPGELQILNNLQSRRPGMLVVRSGVTKIFGRYDDERVVGLYRRAKVLGNPSDLVIMQRAIVPRELSAEEALEGVWPYKFVWVIRRILGNQDRVIDLFDTIPEDTEVYNFSISEDRHGRLFLFYGHGLKPRIYDPSDIGNSVIPMGLTAPTSQPSVTPAGEGFFLERAEVQFGGGAYYEPPTLTLTGGNPDRPAKLKAIVQNGNVVGVDIIDGGSNYKTPPKITASADRIGSGFRARGVRTSASLSLNGFLETDAGTITGDAAGPNATYGTEDGTENQYIMYHARATSQTVKVVGGSGTEMILDSVDGVEYGDVVTIYPAATTSKWLQVDTIDAETNTITFIPDLDEEGNVVLEGTWTPVAGTGYEVTIARNATIGRARATYDASRRRYTARVPLTSSSVSGQGAAALLEFSPLPLGYMLDDASNSSVAATDNRFQQYNRSEFGRGNRQTSTGFRPFLYGEYWQGSEYDIASSAENSQYGGIQASGTRFVKGFTGTVDNRSADVYFPDYSAISVWFNVGTPGGGDGQWIRQDVPVTVETNEQTQVTSKFIEIPLRPSAAAKRATSRNGSAASTNYQLEEELPDAVPPTVRIYLAECPDSWLVNEPQCLPTSVKEARANRLPWFSTASNMERPLVDITRNAQGQIDADSVTIVDPGSGWKNGASFAIRLYQANAYEQRNDYNTATSDTYIPGGHSRTDQYVEFRFTANTPDENTPHGPPNTLITPCLVAYPGEGYSSSDSGSLILLKRQVGLPVEQTLLMPGAYAQTITWQARTISTLSGTATNSIASIDIKSRGRDYFATPTIEIRGGKNGYGLRVLPEIEEGRIVSCQILDAGLNYESDPELYTSSRPAKLSAVMRPAMRGTYRCAYRFVDRSATTIDTVTLTAGDSPTTLNYVAAKTIKPDMILDADALPFNARVVSVKTSELEINQEYSGLNNAEYTGVFSREMVEGIPQPKIALSSVAGVTVGQHVVAEGIPAGTTVTAINEGTISLSADPEGIEDGEEVTVRIQHQVAAFLRDLTKPIAYSDLSPIIDVDAGPNEDRPHASEMRWTLTGIKPPERADLIEFWRTSADQSLVFYRCENYGKPSLDGVEIIGKDTLTDEELFDSERPHYAALPVVLPNGNVNAYRFGEPRTDMSVAVAFQDRLWMGVSTSGEGTNTLYYSEFDEFESIPDVNELPIQNNQKSTDVLTALVPFGSMLLAMQHTHTYSLTYNTDPGIDASIQLMTHRGCLHQRCWDIHENVLYAADESGVYAMSRNGEVTDISLPIRDLFVSEVLDFSKRESFFLQADPRTHILRFFCTLKSQGTETPAMALCFDIQARSWWTESYPTSMTGATTGRPGDARINTVIFGAADGNIYELDGDQDVSSSSITDTVITEGGSGYREAPEITVPNSIGAKVQGVVSEGRLVDVVIQDAGWFAKQGITLMAENGLALADHAFRKLQGVEYSSIPLDISAPEAGGIQAIAHANFSVPPEVRRFCTVSLGEPFVRLEQPRVVAFEPSSYDALTTEDGVSLSTEEPVPRIIRTQPPIVRVGMEAIGEFIPPNALVTRIDRLDVYLSHPDGTPVSIRGGEPRTNEPDTTEDYLENGGTRVLVRFIEPAHTHIPFRAVSGFSQRLTGDVDKRANGEIDRSLTLVYTPTRGDKEIELIERFNGQEEMRPNSMRRERGGPGTFVHRQDSASTVLNTNREASALGFATGVAKAKFASRAGADLTGSDQYQQWELYGRPTRSDPFERVNFWEPDPTVNPPLPLVLHSLTVEGVIDGE